MTPSERDEDRDEDFGEDDSDAETPGQARAIPPLPPTVADRVDYIQGVMERFEWVTGKTAVLIAEAWGLAKTTVEGYSAEASRRITSSPEDARRDITAGCRKLFAEAVVKRDAKAARMMGELWAQVSGAKAPEKFEGKVAGVSLSDLDQMRKAAAANEDDDGCDPKTESEPNS